MVYTCFGGGDWPAILYPAMCSTSSYLDGATRSALLTQARLGDRESLAKLILPYAPGLYLGALRLTRNPADAEDVRQEVCLKAMTRLEQFAGTPGENRDDLHAWVSRIAANASIDVIRKRRDGKLFSLEEPSPAGEETLGSNVAAREDNPEERFARREMRKRMADAISQLSPDLRQVCLLRDVLQYSTQEVAVTPARQQQLFLSVSSIRSNKPRDFSEEIWEGRSRIVAALSQVSHGTESAPHSSVSVRWIHRDARRHIGRQENRARQRTQLEWMLRRHKESLSSGHVPGDKTFHREGIF